jgi:hypothetical protein
MQINMQICTNYIVTVVLIERWYKWALFVQANPGLWLWSDRLAKAVRCVVGGGVWEVCTILPWRK